MSEGFERPFEAKAAVAKRGTIPIFRDEASLWVGWGPTATSGWVTHFETGLPPDIDFPSSAKGVCSWESPLWQTERVRGEGMLVLCSSRQEFQTIQWLQILHDGERTKKEFSSPLLRELVEKWHGEYGSAGMLSSGLPSLHLGCFESVECAPGVSIFPMKTPTLPPATHTNCVVLGFEELSLVDPGGGSTGELERLIAWLKERQKHGRSLKRIILTHHHMDHIGGVRVLQREFDVPVCAHPETAIRLRGQVGVDEYVEHEDWLRISADWEVQALHTPGHAVGHVVLWDPENRWMVAGDMVAGQGTIVIDPPEGDMSEYIAQLNLMRALHPEILIPAHGSFISEPDGLLAAYVAHRLAREEAILNLLEELETARADQLVTQIYAGLDPRAIPLAIRQLLAHLIKLEREGRVHRVSESHWGLKVPG